MASASCSPPPPLSLSCARALGNRTVSLLPSQCQRRRFGGSSSTFHLQTKKGFRAPNFPLSLRILCTRDHKAEVVTGESWDKLILKSEIPVLVEFYANWCGPCRMVHRVIDEIAIEYAGKLKCFVLNTDHDSQVSENYDIKAVPVVFLFKNGEKRESVVGTMPKEFYVSAIERVLA